MKILAIDTTETACSAALNIDGETRSRLKIAPRQHSELILPMMDELLQEAGLNPSQLDALAFARGPGSFTGVRIAAAVIQGVAYAADLPVVPVSSLRALAQGAWRCHGSRLLLAAFDARMQQLYWGVFQLNGVMQLVGEESVSTAQSIASNLAQRSATSMAGVGSGWIEYAPLLPTPGSVFADRQVDAFDVATLGIADIALAVPAEGALPVYIRNYVARKQL